MNDKFGGCYKCDKCKKIHHFSQKCFIKQCYYSDNECESENCLTCEYFNPNKVVLPNIFQK